MVSGPRNIVQGESPMQRVERIKPVTRADVAARAGVSAALVSYVVTGARKVGPGAEARIRKAIDELGYQPNRTARALKTGRTDVLGLIVSDVTNPYFAEFALEIEQAAADRGRVVILVNSHARLEHERSLVADLIARGVDGLIIGSSYLPGASTRQQEHLPTVWIDAAVSDETQIAVGPAMAEGSDEVVTHLIERHGKQRIALALGGGPRIAPDQRQVGWSAALRRAGLPEGPIAQRSWSREGGYECGRELLTADDRPDAVFAGSDLVAVGLIRAASDLGLRIPEDVALVSYDGTKESEFSSPRLTTLRQPIPAMARAAVDAVLEPTAVPHFQSFRGELLVRESCGCGPLN